MDPFSVICLVTWPLNESEAGVDPILIQTSLLFLCSPIHISNAIGCPPIDKQNHLVLDRVKSITITCKCHSQGSMGQ